MNFLLKKKTRSESHYSKRVVYISKSEIYCYYDWCLIRIPVETGIKKVQSISYLQLREILKYKRATIQLKVNKGKYLSFNGIPVPSEETKPLPFNLLKCEGQGGFEKQFSLETCSQSVGALNHCDSISISKSEDGVILTARDGDTVIMFGATLIKEDTNG